MTVSAALQDRLAALQPPGLMIIDGRKVAALSGATFANISPRDGEPINDVAAGDKADVDLAVAAARAAFEDGRWRDRAPADKKKTLLRLAELMEADRENLALLEALDVGKPLHDARNVDIPLAIQTTRWYAEALDKVYGEVGPSGPGRLSYAVY
jgi:gamma-glutamyl-gamma-aminobutyraldehyde dehydrogenase